MVSRWTLSLLLGIYVSAICACPAVDPEEEQNVDNAYLIAEEAQINGQNQLSLQTEHHNNQTCHLAVNDASATYFTNAVQDTEPNLANIVIRFVGNFTINQTADAILPHRWVWTFYIPNGFFPYLKLPADFNVLSLSLLGVKTLLPHLEDGVLLDINVAGNCSLTLGSLNTTQQLGYAFKDFTQKYLMPVHEREFGLSYWCFTKEVPRIKETLAYTLAIHLGSPVEFSRYNCCKTTHQNPYKRNRTALSVLCIDQIPTMFRRIVVMPYITALIAFAYFPILLFTCAGQKLTRKRHYTSDYVDLDEEDWVMLDGKSPITFMYLIGSLCGLDDLYPILVSRIRRLYVLLSVPVILYVHIYIYWIYLHDTVIAHLDHGQPLGYMSLLAGFSKSRHRFAPFLGGPACLLIVYHAVGVLFVLFPKDLNTLLHPSASNYDQTSPLLYSDHTITHLSGVQLHGYFGYSKIAATCRAGVYTLTNKKFWVSSVSLQLNRILRPLGRVSKISNPWRSLCYVVFIFLIPGYTFLCVAELVACVLFYGVPVITTICVIVKGYTCALNAFLEKRLWTESTRLSELIGKAVLKLIFRVILYFLFAYFTISVSSIIVSVFFFLCQLIVFCLFSIAVYPTTSFGYIFFSATLVYYIVKQIELFGDSYFELLSMAVEICSHMDQDLSCVRIENDIIVINKTNGSRISKLRVQNHAINLSTDQRNQIQTIQCAHQQRITYKNNIVGISRHLFEQIVNHFRPVHVQVFHTVLRLVLITLLVAVVVSLAVVKPFGSTETLSEILHVIFIIAVGALPKLLELTIHKTNHAVVEEIKRNQLKAFITEYWTKEDAMLVRQY